MSRTSNPDMFTWGLAALGGFLLYKGLKGGASAIPEGQARNLESMLDEETGATYTLGLTSTGEYVLCEGEQEALIDVRACFVLPSREGGWNIESAYEAATSMRSLATTVLGPAYGARSGEVWTLAVKVLVPDAYHMCRGQQAEIFSRDECNGEPLPPGDWDIDSAVNYLVHGHVDVPYDEEPSAGTEMVFVPSPTTPVAAQVSNRAVVKNASTLVRNTSTSSVASDASAGSHTSLSNPLGGAFRAPSTTSIYGDRFSDGDTLTNTGGGSGGGSTNPFQYDFNMNGDTNTRQKSLI